MNPTLLERAADLMLYGMGVVFVFLGLLIVITSLVSWLARKFGPPPVASEAAEPAADALRQAAVSAAVHHHRRKKS